MKLYLVSRNGWVDFDHNNREMAIYKHALDKYVQSNGLQHQCIIDGFHFLVTPTQQHPNLVSIQAMGGRQFFIYYE
jgi:hypothetical protein